MNDRELRGQTLAMRTAGKIRRKGALWVVPSQSHAGTYVVDPTDKTCTCPDYELHHQPCKHIYAVEYTTKAEITEDGKCTITKTLRVTYKQDWPAYNAAQCNEKERVAKLLHALCSGIIQPPQKGRGRPRLQIADMLFAACMKVYSTVSGRRADTDMREFHRQGLLSAKPCYNSIFNYLENPALTPILKVLIEESALPLRSVESDFMVDSTGFTTVNYTRWYDAKYGREMSEHVWLKAHIMNGRKTNIVTSVEITEGDVHDSPQFVGLVQSTAKRFKMAEVSADKAYLSKENVGTVLLAGAVPYIPFKSNSTGTDGPEIWQKLYHYYQLNRREFLAHYHKRSNAESTVWMIKSKFGGSVRSKLHEAQVNEILCKVLCHNLCCLVSSTYELGIDPKFWAGTPKVEAALAG
jgi:transposase